MSVAPTTGGDVEGRAEPGLVRFEGIPYARAARFCPPEPPAPWQGIRRATAPGPACHQPPAPMQAALGAPDLPQSEDCLHLSVVTPAVDGAARPVLVWIHGGGFVTGSATSPISDGGRMAARGDVVVVSINYRLGAFGFLHLAELDPALGASGLHGILDQVAALEWVRDNIAGFGGDPGNVTVVGGSAGAMSIGVLLALPVAQGLFRRAILQSGAGQGAVGPAEAAARARRLGELAGCRTIGELRALPAPALLEAQVALGEELAARVPPTWDRGFGPVVDGGLLPRDPLSCLAAGTSPPVDLILGTTDDEWRLFSWADAEPSSDGEVAVRLAGAVVDPASVVAGYRARLGSDASAGAVRDAVLGDLHFRLPMERLADAAVAAGNRTWVYRFAWRTPVADLGACHALEVPFVFDNRDGLVPRFVGDASPDSLAAAMQEAWVAFARNGDPNHDGIPGWAPQTVEQKPVLRFDERTSVVDAAVPEALATRW